MMNSHQQTQRLQACVFASVVCSTPLESMLLPKWDAPQAVFNKLFESANFIDQVGDSYFQLEDVKKIFERELALPPAVRE